MPLMMMYQLGGGQTAKSRLSSRQGVLLIISLASNIRDFCTCVLLSCLYARSLLPSKLKRVSLRFGQSFSFLVLISTSWTFVINNDIGSYITTLALYLTIIHLREYLASVSALSSPPIPILIPPSPASSTYRSTRTLTPTR